MSTLLKAFLPVGQILKTVLKWKVEIRLKLEERGKILLISVKMYELF